MRIRVVYCGGSRVQAGRADEELELAASARVGDAVREVLARHPALAPLASSARWAKNYELASEGEVLAEGDELALLPPVAGGAPRATLTGEILDPNAVIEDVQHAGAGATVVFVGTVRDHARGKAVTTLEYEAYEPMAVKQLDRIAARSERDGARVSLAHRIGGLAVGEVSLVIAVSAPHRELAFERCREVLEAIKVEAPIWKREVGPDGESWVGWGGG